MNKVENIPNELYEKYKKELEQYIIDNDYALRRNKTYPNDSKRILEIMYYCYKYDLEFSLPVNFYPDTGEVEYPIFVNDAIQSSNCMPVYTENELVSIRSEYIGGQLFRNIVDRCIESNFGIVINPKNEKEGGLFLTKYYLLQLKNIFEIIESDKNGKNTNNRKKTN